MKATAYDRADTRTLPHGDEERFVRLWLDDGLSYARVMALRERELSRTLGRLPRKTRKRHTKAKCEDCGGRGIVNVGNSTEEGCEHCGGRGFTKQVIQ